VYGVASKKPMPVRLSVIVLFSTMQPELLPLKYTAVRFCEMTLLSMRMPEPPVTVVTPMLFSPGPTTRVIVNPERRVLLEPRSTVSFAPPSCPTIEVVAAPAPRSETPTLLRLTSSLYAPAATLIVPFTFTRVTPRWMVEAESAPSSCGPTPSQ
jgi:hypothetical protein